MLEFFKKPFSNGLQKVGKIYVNKKGRSISIKSKKTHRNTIYDFLGQFCGHFLGQKLLIQVKILLELAKQNSK